MPLPLLVQNPSDPFPPGHVHACFICDFSDSDFRKRFSSIHQKYICKMVSYVLKRIGIFFTVLTSCSGTATELEKQ